MRESRVIERAMSGEREAVVSRVMEREVSFDEFIFLHLKEMPDEPEAGEIDRQGHREDEDTDGDFFN
jgi:hypothetical protein